MMLGAAALYALHLPINQRVLYEVPAPTVTLYTLLGNERGSGPCLLLFDPQLALPQHALVAGFGFDTRHFALSPGAFPGHQTYWRYANRPARTR